MNHIDNILRPDFNVNKMKFNVIDETNVIHVDFKHRTILSDLAVKPKLNLKTTGNEQVDSLFERFYESNNKTGFMFLNMAQKLSGWSEPYNFGDIHDIQYRPYNGQGAWNEPFPMPSRVNLKKMKGVIGKGVPNGSGSDPLMWMDRKYRVTHRLIESMKGQKLIIHTRSDLIGCDDYVNVLDKSKHIVFIHYTGVDADLNRVLESGTPSQLRRFKAYEKLKGLGYRVYLIQDIVEGLNFEIETHNETYKTNHIKLTEESKRRIERVLGKSIAI